MKLDTRTELHRTLDLPESSIRPSACLLLIKTVFFLPRVFRADSQQEVIVAATIALSSKMWPPTFSSSCLPLSRYHEICSHLGKGRTRYQKIGHTCRGYQVHLGTWVRSDIWLLYGVVQYFAWCGVVSCCVGAVKPVYLTI